MISQEDAHTFCLVAAQVIPTLLVAHFVVNRILPPGETPKWRKSVEASALKAKEARRNFDATTTELVRRGNQLARVDPDEMSQGARQVYEHERDLIDRAFASMDEMRPELDRLEKGISGQASQSNYPLLDKWYSLMLVLVIIDGLVGESTSILGSFRLYFRGLTPRDLAIYAGTAIIVILGLMAQAAWLRFTPRRVNLLFPGAIAILLGLTQLGISYAAFASSAQGSICTGSGSSTDARSQCGTSHHPPVSPSRPRTQGACKVRGRVRV